VAHPLVRDGELDGVAAIVHLVRLELAGKPLPERLNPRLVLHRPELPGVDSRDALRLSVDPVSVEPARAVLNRHGASYTLRVSGNKARFLIANPSGLTGDEHPYGAALPGDLLAAGVRVIAYRAP
jgi:hypothetical protein